MSDSESDDLFDVFGLTEETNIPEATSAELGLKRTHQEAFSSFNPFAAPDITREAYTFIKSTKTSASLLTTPQIPTVIEVPDDILKLNLEADKLKCIHHHVVFPPEMDVPPMTDPIFKCEAPPLDKRAHSFGFPLDPFQLKSVAAISRGESVMVSAHTSAGKTAVAEYAIATALARNQRVIYTSPIKALSNQKYRDFAQVFESVGLMTGDTTVNRNADLVVMTTEILRNMLFQGSEVIREIGWVVFDEVHYMRDAERGVVWEEVLIQLPDQVRFVFLSATVPNAAEFAGWIAALHSQPVHAVYTDFRPTPLRHFLAPVGGEGIFPVKAGDEVIQENFRKVDGVLAKTGTDKSGATRSQGNNRNRSQALGVTLERTVDVVIKRRLTPCIVFSFGKKKVERLAKRFGSKNLLSRDQQETVDAIFAAALQELPAEDRDIQPVRGALALLRRGFAVHHAGLLPWVKELTEIMFQNDLVKVLFATETFAMGLNLPARTAVFSEITKFDGVRTRHLRAGEYIQMAGRAGRRGKDKEGYVITLIQTPDEVKASKKMLTGDADPLNSAFRLSFYMLLNMSALEGTGPEAIIDQSYLQHQNKLMLPKWSAEIKGIEDAAKANSERVEQRVAELVDSQKEHLPLPDINCLLTYLTKCRTRDSLGYQFRSAVVADRKLAERFSSYLVPGRVVGVNARSASTLWVSWGVVITPPHLVRRGRRMVEEVKLLCPGRIHPDAGKRGSGVAYARPDILIDTVSGSSAAQDEQADAPMPTSEVVDRPVPLGDLMMFEPARPALWADRFDRLKSIVPVEVGPGTMLDDIDPVILQVPLDAIERITKGKIIGQAINKLQAGTARVSLTVKREVILSLIRLLRHKQMNYNPDPIGPKVMKLDATHPAATAFGAMSDMDESLRADDTHRFLMQQSRTQPRLVATLLGDAEQQQRREQRRSRLVSHISGTGSRVLQPVLSKMLRVLRSLDYIDTAGNLKDKGKVASRINCVHELLITECLFNTVFTQLEPPVLAGLLCALVAERKKDGPQPPLPQELREPVKLLRAAADTVAAACASEGVELGPGIKSAHELVVVGQCPMALLWAKGRPLSEVLELDKNAFEGSIVRLFRRLVILLQQVRESLEGINDDVFKQRLEIAESLIFRGVVKCPSLYMQDEAVEE